MTRIEYGVPTDKCAITVRMGIEQGFFRDEGIDLSVRVVFGGPQIATAYDSGELRFGEMGSPPCLNAISRGARFRIVGGGVRQKAHMYLGVRNDIGSYADLKGKRLGLLGLGSCPEWIGRAMFLREGLDPDRDITFVPLLAEYPRVIPVMEEGRIDAALAVEPNLALGERKNLLKVWAAAYDPPYLPEYQWIVVVARQDLIATEPNLVRALLRAWQRSAHHARAHVDEWVDFACRQYGVDEWTARRAVERELPHLHFDGQVNLAGLRKAIDLQRTLGGVTGPMTVDDVARLEFVPMLSEAGAPGRAG